MKIKNRLLGFASWFFGLSSLLYAIYGLLDGNIHIFVFLYLVSIGLILLPPINKLINRSSYAKQIKTVIGVTFFVTLILSGKVNSEVPEIDRARTSNLDLLRIISEQYCIEAGFCAESLDQVFAEYTAPFESYNPEDYTYEQLDGGVDCVVGTKLSTGEIKTRLCIGEDLKYLKYIQN